MAPGRGYRHLLELARGGVGTVHVAIRRDDPARQLVAVKRLHAEHRDDPRARRTLVAEAELAGGVSHPNVLRVLECGEDGDGPFLAMEYVEGCSLAQLISQVARADEEIPLQIAIGVARQIAAGLHAIHDQMGGLLVVHRDVSPQNVLIGYDGRVRVADFGIAKPLNPSEDNPHGETSTGLLKGKIAYMAPEQLRFETPDRRADLFALGVILWEMLAGRRLYHGHDGAEGARRILHEPPPDIGDEREDAPPEVVQLLFELLSKVPATRPATAAIVADRLRVCGELLAQEEGPIDLGDYTRSFFERERAGRRELIERALERSRALDVAEQEFGAAADAPRRRDWHVKGAAIKASVEYLRAVYGEAGYAKVVAGCPPKVRASLEGAILLSTWYDGEVMVALTEVAQALFDAPDLAFQVGEASADFAFGDGGPYEVFRRQGIREGVPPLLDASGEIYRLYYDVGTWIVEEVTDTAAVIRIDDGLVFPRPIADRIVGYLRRALALVGCEDVVVSTLKDGEDLLLSTRWRDPGGGRGRISRPPSLTPTGITTGQRKR
ncbi:MAG: serine/threonine protein kinase [Myxococcales bacterium]|nr:serine/threonine protein kinase [Myxococcales bacterium]